MSRVYPETTSLWSAAEDERLRRVWGDTPVAPTSTAFVRAVAREFPGRTGPAVEVRARSLGLEPRSKRARRGGTAAAGAATGGPTTTPTPTPGSSGPSQGPAGRGFISTAS